MKAFKGRAKGRVQRVGYRRYLLDQAQEPGLSGLVRNEPDGTVSFFVQGPEHLVGEFLRRAREPPPPARVEGLEVEEAEPDSRLKYFKVEYGPLQEELQEGMGAMHSTFIEYWREFRDFRQEFRDFRQETQRNFFEMDGKYGDISKKLTEILESLKRESEESRRELKRSVDLLSKLVDEFIRSARR